jgi:hypothetical protein
LIVLLNDPNEMVGGELEVLARDRDNNALDVLNSIADSYKPSEIMKVDYGQAGNGVFMQGSHIFHQVKPLFAGPRPRISLVYR